MTGRPCHFAALIAGLLLLAGCAGPDVTTRSPTAPSSRSPATATGTAATTGAARQPSLAARMICTAEARSDIAETVGLTTIPVGRITWADSTYSCTYQLPAGPLGLSVHELPDAPTTTRYLSGLRQDLGTTHALIGLGPGAFGTADGTVILSKDNAVLRVDATGLPAQFGEQSQKRTDLAYEIASIILGCWTGH